MKTKLILITLGLLACSSGVTQAASPTTAFTYQGRLFDGGVPANGLYDLQFTNYDAATAGNALGAFNLNAVPVSNGLFAVTLDFGPVFDGTLRWLELSERTNGAAAFATLAPRQPLAAAPYATYASSAGVAALATNVPPGAINSTAIASGQVVKSLNGLHDDLILAPGANITLTPSGSTLTIAATAGASAAWGLTGNAGTTPGVNFLGTTDNQPLEFRVWTLPVFRLGLNGSIGMGTCTNHGGDSVALGLNSAANGDYSTALGAWTAATASSATAMGWSTIASGHAATALGMFSVATGDSSTAMGLLTHANGPSSFAAGGGATAAGSAAIALGGGTTAASDYSTALGVGTLANGGGATALGTNTTAHADGATAMGNQTYASGASSTASGYQTSASGEGSTALGNGGSATGDAATALGYQTTAAGYASVALGRNAVASGDYATALGYYTQATGNSSTALGDAAIASGDCSVAMGQNCVASAHDGVALGYYASATNVGAVAIGNGVLAGGQNSLALGYASQALHDGVFAWGDYSGRIAFSTGPNQFIVSATGGASFRLGSSNAKLQADDTSTYPDAKQLVIQGDTNPNRQLELGYKTADSANYGVIQAVEQNSAFRSLVLQPSGGSVAINKVNPASALDVNGTVTATAFNPSSDRNLKEHLGAVNPREILDQVAGLPIWRWNFKADAATPHLGPMAQDFYAAFNVGSDDRHIATVDADGVALAAIQGLNQKLEETRSDNATLRADNSALRADNADLRARLERLEHLLQPSK